MNKAIFVLNAGSSSLKFSLFHWNNASPALMLSMHGSVEKNTDGLHLLVHDANNVLLKELTQKTTATLFATEYPVVLKLVLQVLRDYLQENEIVAIGHRVVHGGDKFSLPVLIDATSVDELAKLVPLAPLHQPYNLAGITTTSKLFPGVPQVACFDTAFHLTQPTIARWFGLPRKYFNEGVKRYGFHGLSYEYITTTFPQYCPQHANGKIIIAHLGQGASLCAIEQGKSVATTMGFTALDGLLMGTRCGALDPGVVPYLQSTYKLSLDEIAHLLYQESGLLGVSTLSGDLRTLLQSTSSNAKEAIELFIYRLISEIGQLSAILQGVDALVFTGGIGEHAALIRSRVGQALNWLGLRLNEDANNANQALISTPESKIATYVIPTNEELMIAQHAINVLH